METARERVRQSRARFLIDAYCGVGFFSIELASQVEYFTGVEIDAAAIKAARRNAAAHGKTNGEFIAGAAETLLGPVLERFEAAATTVVIDPPRRGCEPQLLEVIRRRRPAQVLYVSCHPATLARDLNVLCLDNVFELSKIVPFDMFPQTQHVECLADLRAVASSRAL